MCGRRREVAVSEPVHQAITERIELLARARLRNARPAAAGFAESRNAQYSRAREGRICWRRKVHMEFPKVQKIRPKVEKEVGRAGRRPSRSIQVRGKQAAKRRRELKADASGGGTRQDGGAIKRASFGPYKCVPAKHIERPVVSIGPHTVFGIVREVIHRERIAMERAGRIAGGGNRDTDREWRREDGLRQEPSVCCLVILGDDVATVRGFATSAEAAPERIASNRTEYGIAGGFVKDRERFVHPLHHLRGADGRIRVWRGAVDRERAVRSHEAVADPIEIQP